MFKPLKPLKTKSSPEQNFGHSIEDCYSKAD